MRAAGSVHRCICGPNVEKGDVTLVPFKAAGRELCSTVATLEQCPFFSCMVMSVGGRPTYHEVQIDHLLLVVLLRFLRTHLLLLPEDDEDAANRVAIQAKQRGFCGLVRALEAQGYLREEEEDGYELVEGASWSDVIPISVRGRSFATTRRTLLHGHFDRPFSPGEPLHREILEYEENADDWRPVEIDCDPECFDIILRYLRSGVILPPSGFESARLLLHEASKLRLNGMIDAGSRAGGIFETMVERFPAAGAYKSQHAITFECETESDVDAEVLSEFSAPDDEAPVAAAAAAAAGAAGALKLAREGDVDDEVLEEFQTHEQRVAENDAPPHH